MFDIGIIAHSLPEYARGAWMTIQLVGIALACGLAAAIPLAILRVSRNPWLSRPVYVYTYFFRGTPMLVQLLVVYYGFSQFAWLRAQWEAGSAFWLLLREPYFCALLAFGVNTCAYTVEIIAGCIRSIPYGEIEAAKAMGMTRMVMLRRIVLPAALRRAIPAYSNEVIFMLQGSSIASAVTLVDLTGAARDVYSRHFAPFEAFIFAGACYLVLTFAIVAAFRQIERRYLAHLQPRRAQAAH